jgi:hypothetical protein
VLQLTTAAAANNTIKEAKIVFFIDSIFEQSTPNDYAIRFKNFIQNVKRILFFIHTIFKY